MLDGSAVLELESFSLRSPQLIICISLSGAPVLAFAKDVLPSCFIPKIYDSALQRDTFPSEGFSSLGKLPMLASEHEH